MQIHRFAFLFLFLSTTAFAQHQTQPQTALSPEDQKLFEEAKCVLVLPHLESAIQNLGPQEKSKTAGEILYKAGVCFNAVSRYEEAQSVLVRAQKIHLALGDQDAVAMDMIEIAGTDRFSGKFEEGLTLAKDALITEKKTGNRMGQACALREIGAIELARGGYPDALGSTQESLVIAEELQDQRGIAYSLKDLGAIHLRLGKFEDAKECLDRSLKIAEEMGDKRLQSKVLSNMALSYGFQGDLRRDLELGQKATPLAEESGDLQQLTIIFLNSGSSYFNMGNFAKAYDFLSKGTALAQKIKNQRLYSGGLLGLSMTEFEFGNEKAGMDSLEKSLAIAEKMNDKNILHYALNQLGSHSLLAGDTTSAFKYYSRSLQLAQEMDDKFAMTYSQIYIGNIFVKQGKPDQALQSYQKALQISQASGMKKAMADVHNDMAVLYYGQKQLPEAEGEVSKAIVLAGGDGYRDLQADALHTQGLIFRDTGKVEEAITSMQQSVQLIESIRSELDSPEEKAGFLETRRNIYEDLIELLLKQNKKSEAFGYAQRSKARAFLDLLVEMDIDVGKGLPPDLREKKEALVNEMVEIQSQIREENDKDSPSNSKVKSLEEKSNQLEEQYRNIVREIRKRAPQLAEVWYPEPLDVEQTQSLLDPQSILLEYFVGKEGSLLFAITHESLNVYRLPTEKNLSDTVNAIRDALQKPDPVQQVVEGAYSRYVTSSSSLYQMLLQPASADIQGKSRLLIAPDGPLHYLPFECLLSQSVKTAQLDFSKLPYVTRNFEIQYISSASVLASLHSQEQLNAGGPRQKELLAFADPALPTRNQTKDPSSVRGWVGTLSDLPHAKTEVEGIAQLYPRETILTFYGNQASEKNLKHMDLESYQRLHFASHGLIDEEKPQFSALVLSPDPNDEEDGFLTVREVFELKLNADLVVLSACKTGLGRTIRGEGVSGLSRAFLSSGARNVLVSLWNVYDSSTASFMKAFYRNMQQDGTDKLKSLKDARTSMIQSVKYSHPYYWAPFVLIGKN